MGDNMDIQMIKIGQDNRGDIYFYLSKDLYIEPMQMIEIRCPLSYPLTTRNYVKVRSYCKPLYMEVIGEQQELGYLGVFQGYLTILIHNLWADKGYYPANCPLASVVITSKY